MINLKDKLNKMIHDYMVEHFKKGDPVAIYIGMKRDDKGVYTKDYAKGKIKGIQEEAFTVFLEKGGIKTIHFGSLLTSDQTLFPVEIEGFEL